MNEHDTEQRAGEGTHEETQPEASRTNHDSPHRRPLGSRQVGLTQQACAARSKGNLTLIYFKSIDASASMNKYAHEINKYDSMTIK